MPTNTDLDLDDDELADLTRERDDDDPLITKLRRRVKSQSKELRDLRPLRTEVAEIKLSDSLNKAFDAEEIKLISAEKKTAMLSIAGDDKSPESLRKAAITLGFVEAKVDPHEQELEGHERVERAGTGANAAAGVKIDADVVADWPMDKQLRFKAEHASAWEQIKRGEAVHGITF